MMKAEVLIEAELLAGMLWALAAYKFALATPPVNTFDGRIDVWQAGEAIRLAKFEAVNQLLAATQNLT